MRTLFALPPHTSLSLVTASCASLLMLGCGSNNAENNADDNSSASNSQTATPSNNATPSNTQPNSTTTPVGKASLLFKPTYGSNFANQLPPSWRAPLAVPQRAEDSPLVVMLCASSDDTCEDPLEVVEVQLADRAPVQGSFGPDVQVDGLPEGEYNVMIFLDSEDSRARGLGWESTPARNVETAWGGHVSEFDVMMSDPSVSPSADLNPPPMPVRVMLSAAAPVDLGKLRLGHFHERRMDPVPQPENGAIAVVTEAGLRMIDLNTFEVADAGGGLRDYFLLDSQNEDLSSLGNVCGMIQGQGSVIYVLYKNPSSGAGFVAPFDARSRMQLGGGNLIKLPGSPNDTPCNGIYHEVSGKKFLYIANVGAAGTDKGNSTMWYADVTDINSGDVDATQLKKDADTLHGVGFTALAAHHSTLYATMTPQVSDQAFVPAPAVNHHTIFKAAIDPTTGRPDFQASGDYDYWTPLPSKDGVITPSGNIDCITSDSSGGTFAGLFKASFHTGKTMLFLGGCSNISIFDLDADEQLDAAPNNPRSKDLDGTLFGHGYTRFALSPDGATLYVLPQYKSPIQFYFAKGGDTSSRQTYNRYMIYPLALDQGSIPALHPDFTGDNIDDHQGGTDIGNHITPANDPGIDINAGHLTRYQVDWAPDLAGSTNQAASLPTGPSIAAGKNTIWLRGSGVPGVSGQSKGANLMTYSVSERRAHFWAHNQRNEGWDFYHVWQGGNEPDRPFGYDLTPENNAYLATYGLLYIDMN